jgi:DNA gyrase/topoisomerase IV subunit A
LKSGKQSTYSEGLIIASDNIDEVIALIKASKKYRRGKRKIN